VIRTAGMMPANPMRSLSRRSDTWLATSAIVAEENPREGPHDRSCAAELPDVSRQPPQTSERRDSKTSVQQRQFALMAAGDTQTQTGKAEAATKDVEPVMMPD
jgi:hypothetical protein